MLSPMDLRRALPTIAIVTLLVLDAVLVIWALWPASSPTTAPVSSGTTDATASASPDASGSPSPSPSASASPDAGPRPLERDLVGVDARSAWVATTGTCEEPGPVHVTTDAGATWRERESPGAVTRIRPSGRTEAFVVGGEQGDCDMRLWTTTDGGQEWGDAASASAAWARTPDDARRVIRPGGEPVTPCGKAVVLDLASLGRETASVVCGDGRVRTTGNGGDSWPTAFRIEGALAFSLAPSGRGAVAARDADCDGTTVVPLTGGAPQESTCVEGASATPGQVAVSVTDGASWLLAGDEVFTAPSQRGPWTKAKGSVG